MCSAYGNKGPAAGNILLYVADIADASGRLTARVNRDGLCGNRVPRYSVFLNLTSCEADLCLSFYVWNYKRPD